MLLCFVVIVPFDFNVAIVDNVMVVAAAMVSDVVAGK